MNHSISVRAFTQDDAHHYIPDVARLRIEVFREFPYLYDGDLAYESKYLQTYIESPDSVIVIAFDGNTVIGASTALPLQHETEEIKRPFVENHFQTDEIFYLGESVLLNQYRGRGIGVQFFKERERHAANIGNFRWSAFCAVERPDDHPRRPENYIPLNAFWNNRGYQVHPELRSTFTWRDLDEKEQSAKPMVFWLKELM